MRPIVDLLLIAGLTLMGCRATPQGATDAEVQERFEPKDYSGTGVQGGAALLARADVAAPRSAPMAFHQKTVAAGGAPLVCRPHVAAGDGIPPRPNRRGGGVPQ